MADQAVIDLTEVSDHVLTHSAPASSVPIPAVVPSNTVSKKRPLPAQSTNAPKPPTKKVSKKDNPHALLWICGAGRGQGRTWKQKALRVIGIYADKAGAERKKDELMSKYDCCGHGDIVVGGTWEDEIDLVVRPVEEVKL